MSLTPEKEGFRSSTGREGWGWVGTEESGTSDSHTSGISPRDAIFSPHGNCIRGYSYSWSSEALPEAGDGAALYSGLSTRLPHSMVTWCLGCLGAVRACQQIAFAGV